MSQLIAALGTAFFSHAAVAMASFVVPVLAPQMLSVYGVDGQYVGLYSSLVYLCSFLFAMLSVDLIARAGPVRIMALLLVSTSLGLVILLVHAPAAVFLSALFFGVAFGPSNPAGSVLLDKTTPARLRGRVFSIKQCSVPLGGFVVASAAPATFAWLGMNGVVVLSLVVCLVILVGVVLSDKVIGYPAAGKLPRWSLKKTVGAFDVFVTNGDLRNIALVAAGLAAVQYTFSATTVYVLARYGNFTPVGAAAVLSSVMVISIAARITMGWLSDVIDARFVIIIVAALLAGMCFLFPLLLGEAAIGVVAVAAIAFGTTTLSWNSIVLSALAELVPHEKVGAATAGNMAFGLAGGIAGPAIFTFLLTATGAPSMGYWMMGLCAAGAFALSLRLPARRRVEPAADEC